MKMSESFSLPLFAKYERDFTDEYVQNVYDNVGDVLLPCVPDDVDSEAIVVAINNHDTLTERVKELESAIEEVGQYILSIKTNAHNVDIETVSSETREAFAIIAKVLNKEK